jgi:hypothetical protein
VAFFSWRGGAVCACAICVRVSCNSCHRRRLAALLTLDGPNDALKVK